MSIPSLAVERLSYTYPDGSEALHDVDLHVHPGERVALLGPNGAGKTTLVLHLNGLLRGSGTVRVAGLTLGDDTVPEIRRRVGVVFQDPDDMLFSPTVREDVAFGPANLQVADVDQRVELALAAVGLTGVASKAPHHLSGGEKRRAAIAAVLAMRPEILVLDEPASNLDPAGRRELIGVLAALDVTELIVTHDLLLALELCSRSIVLDGGRVVADGPTAELLADPGLLRAHRLELPVGIDPGLLRRGATGRGR